MQTSGVAQVFLLGLLTAVATGLGALPFLFARNMSRRWLGTSNALASELMPDALEETSHNRVAVVVTLSVAAMVAFQFSIR